jgi:hypothetical protein
MIQCPVKFKQYSQWLSIKYCPIGHCKQVPFNGSQKEHPIQLEHFPFPLSLMKYPTKQLVQKLVVI